jgi:hypothetical protein
MSSVSPNFGSLNGDNYIYIYGDFPYAATSDYVAQDDLVAHYDGINNRGLGDKQHDYNAAIWKDLKSGFELPRGTGAGQWLSNGFQALNKNYAFYSTDTYPNTYPLGGNPRTIEVIFRTPELANMFVQGQNESRMIFSYGLPGVTSKAFVVGYRGLKPGSYGLPNNFCSEENPWVFYAIGGDSNNLVTCLSSTPSLEEANTINTVTSTYANNMNDPLTTNSYINNTPAVVIARGNTPLNTEQGTLYIGENLSHSTFLSVRLYDRVLDPEEIENNAKLDQIRFLAPPTVMIDGKECTEAVVLSPHVLMCKVPKGSSAGLQNVTVNGTDYSGAYKYVDPDADFYVSGISPIVGSTAGGDLLTLTGKHLDWISEVNLGGKTCNPTGIPNSETCQYDIPDNPPGEVDITITLISGAVYRFAKVFEYQ